MKKMFIPLGARALLATGLAAYLSACAGLPTGAAGSAGLSGTVVREAAIAPSQDGIGTLYIAALPTCAQDQKPLAAMVITQADLRARQQGAPFALPQIRQKAYLAVFLDDNADANPQRPVPGTGDLAYGSNADDGQLDCVEAMPGTPVTVPLNLNH